ncbi:MAG: hypothetical protein N2B03_05340, partial [Boseongicola sp.]
MAYDLLLALHFLGLFMGGAAGLGLPVLGATIQATQVDHRPSIGKAARPLRLIGQSGVGLLIVTGLVLIFTDGSTNNLPLLFWIKMLLVAARGAGIYRATQAGVRAAPG